MKPDLSLIDRACEAFSTHVPEVRNGVVTVRSAAAWRGRAVYVAVDSAVDTINPVVVCSAPPRPRKIANALSKGRLTIILWSELLEERIRNSLTLSDRLSGVMRAPPNVSV